MTNLHIIQNEKITKGSISFCRRNATADENPYVVLGGAFSYTFEEFENIQEIDDTPKGIIKLYRMMKKADRVHIHGLFSIYLVVLLALCPRLGQKCNWYIFGNDFYYITKDHKSLPRKMHSFFRKKAIKNIKYISTNVVGDYELVCKYMGKKYEFFELRFSRGSIEAIAPYVKDDIKNEKAKILLGNSATETNCHMEALDLLAKYKDEDFLVYVPLSYGNMDYAESVIDYGQRLLGEKFIPLKDFMPPNEYFELLSEIDIAIFAHNRQQGIGNIVPLIYSGAKVYMRESVTTWNSLVKDYGLNVFSIDNIRNESYEQFVNNTINVEIQRAKCLKMTDPKKEDEAFLKTLL